LVVGWYKIILGAALKLGKITSTVGDEIIASANLTQKPLDLEAARKLVGASVFLKDDPNAKSFGKVSGIIARTDEPYFVIKRFKRKVPVKGEDDLLGKPVYVSVKLKF